MVVAAVLVFPASVVVILGVVNLAGKLLDITMSSSMSILLGASCLFAAGVTANRAYHWIASRRR